MLAPPGADFWGTQLSTAGDYVTLHYPERDAEINYRLAEDLNSLLGGICAEVNCPADLHVDVQTHKENRERIKAFCSQLLYRY